MNQTKRTEGFVKATEHTGEERDLLVVTDADVKVAKFLAIIGRNEASYVLQRFTPDESERILHALAAIDSVDPFEARKILAEFGAGMREFRHASSGGPDVARDILTRMYGSEEGERRFYQILPEERPHLFPYLADLSDRQIVAVLGEESIAVLSLIISHASRDTAARVLSAIPAEKKVGVVARLASMEKVERDVVERVEEQLHERLKDTLPVDNSALDGPGALAEILKHMDAASEENILTSIRDENEELSEAVKSRLTTVEDLASIPDRDLQRVLQKIDETDLAIFLKGKSDVVIDAVRKNVSERRWDLLRMNRETLGPMRKSDVQRVTSEIMAMIRKMAEEGEIVIRLDGEKYVG